MNSHSPARNQGAIPGLINDLVKRIITFLPHYDQMVLRNVSYWFRQNIPHPLFEEIKAVMRALPYDVDVDSVSHEHFYITHWGARNTRSTYDDIKKFYAKLTNLHQVYLAQNTLAGSAKLLSELYTMSRISASNKTALGQRLQACHPLMRSILLDMLYHKFNGDFQGSQLLGKGVATSELLLKAFEAAVKAEPAFATPLQKHRMVLCRLMLVLNNSGKSDQQKINEINDLFHFNLSDQPRVLPMLACLVQDSNCFGNIDLFNYLVSHLKEYADKALPVFNNFVVTMTPAYKDMQRQAKPISQVRAAEPADSALKLVNSGVLTPSVEWCRTVHPNTMSSLTDNERKKIFEEYVVANKSLKACFSRPLCDLPIWLRHIVFQPDLLPPQHKQTLMGFDLNQIPRFVYHKPNARMKSSEIANLKNHFRLPAELGVQLCDNFLNYHHDDATIGIMLDLHAESREKRDDIKNLFSIRNKDLKKLVASPVYRHLRACAKLTPEFYQWAAIYLVYLEYVLTLHQDFFLDTLRRLASPYQYYGVTNTSWLEQLTKLFCINELSFLIDIFDPDMQLLKKIMESNPDLLIVSAALARDAISTGGAFACRLPAKAESQPSYQNLYVWSYEDRSIEQDSADLMFVSFWTQTRMYKKLQMNAPEVVRLLWYMGVDYYDVYSGLYDHGGALPALLNFKEQVNDDELQLTRIIAMYLFIEREVIPLKDQLTEVARHGFVSDLNYVRQISAIYRIEKVDELKSVFTKAKFTNLLYVSTVLKYLGVDLTLTLSRERKFFNGNKLFAKFANAASVECLESVLIKLVSCDDQQRYIQRNSDEIEEELRGEIFMDCENDLPQLSLSPGAVFFQPRSLFDNDSEMNANLGEEPEIKRRKAE